MHYLMLLSGLALSVAGYAYSASAGQRLSQRARDSLAFLLPFAPLLTLLTLVIALFPPPLSGAGQVTKITLALFGTAVLAGLTRFTLGHQNYLLYSLLTLAILGLSVCLFVVVQEAMTNPVEQLPAASVVELLARHLKHESVPADLSRLAGAVVAGTILGLSGGRRVLQWAAKGKTESTL